MNRENKKVMVLGEEYTIEYRRESEDPRLSDDCTGYTDPSVRRIVIGICEEALYNCENQEEMRRRTLRHELVHAFAFESGLDANSGWAMDEEMTAWVANQAPKMLDVFHRADAI